MPLALTAALESFEFRRKLLHEDYDARLRVYVDPDCSAANAATMTMLDDELTVYATNGEQWSHECLMSECMRNVAWLRTQPFARHPHPGHLIPFAEILLTDRDRLGAQTRLQVASCIGRVEMDDHTRARFEARDIDAAVMQRVNVLGECIDMADFLERKKRAAK